MALTPQIDGNIISLEQTEKVLPSKTYKINNDVVSTEIEIEEGKPTVAESDEMITIDDLSYEQISLNIKGNSWQETRSGNNLFDISKAKRASGACTFKNNGSSIDIGVTYVGEYISANIDITDLFKEGETVYAIADFVSSSSNTGAYRIQWAEDTGLTKGDIVLMSYSSGSLKSGIIPTKPEGATKLFLYLYGNIAGTAVIGDTVTYSKIMLSNKPITEYEEYGAMPSPEFPSEIKNVTGSVNVILCNKNLLKTLKWITGTYIYAKLPKLNSEYFLSLRLKDGKTIPSDLYFGFSRDGDYNSTGFTKWLIDKGEFSSYNSIDRNTFKYTSNIRYDGTILGYIAVFPATYAGNLKEYFDIQLEEKINYNHATDYVESESQQFTFPLSEGQRMYKDSYLADDGVHHKINNYNYSYNDLNALTTLTNLNHIRVPKQTNDAKYNKVDRNKSILCDKAIYDIRANGYDDANLIGKVYDGGETFYLIGLPKTITTLEEAQEYIGNFSIQYELAEEIIEPYTEEQQLVYNEINDILIESSVINIFSNDEIKPFVKVIYFSADNIIFNTGEKDRIIGYADGLEAIKQAIYHILNTERYAYLIYDDNYGVEFEQYIGKDFNFIQATIEDTLREALTHDLRITDVMVNSIDKIDSNVVAINFTATTVYGDLVLGVNINV